MISLKIGILSSNNYASAHLSLLNTCGVEAQIIEKPDDLLSLQGLIIEVGDQEISPFFKQMISERASKNMGVLALSSGVARIAKNNSDPKSSLELMDITITKKKKLNIIKNIYIPAISKREIKAIFQDAPVIEKVAPNVGILYQFQDQEIVFVRQGSFFACTFNPRLNSELRIYQYFIQRIKDLVQIVDN